jgi:hypothetical protein
MNSVHIDHKEIPGFPGYFVSSSGEVISTAWGKRRVLSTWVNSNGYLTCKAKNGALPIHRAVALAWVERAAGATDVNHKDGNKHNNHYENLEWCTRSQNIYHSLRNGLHDEKESPVVAINDSTGEVLRFYSQAEAGRRGFSQPNINKCLKGIRPRHKGYRWEYDENPLT